MQQHSIKRISVSSRLWINTINLKPILNSSSSKTLASNRIRIRVSNNSSIWPNFLTKTYINNQLPPMLAPTTQTHTSSRVSNSLTSNLYPNNSNKQTSSRLRMKILNTRVGLIFRLRMIRSSRLQGGLSGQRDATWRGSSRYAAKALTMTSTKK